jgi:hypothetical protein
LEPYWEIIWGCNPHFVFDLISGLSPERSTGYTSQKELEWLKNTKDLIQRAVEMVGVAVELESALDACRARCGFGQLEPVVTYDPGRFRSGYYGLYSALHEKYITTIKLRCDGQTKENEIGCVGECMCDL